MYSLYVLGRDSTVPHACLCEYRRYFLYNMSAAPDKGYNKMHRRTVETSPSFDGGRDGTKYEVLYTCCIPRRDYSPLALLHHPSYRGALSPNNALTHPGPAHSP